MTSEAPRHASSSALRKKPKRSSALRLNWLSTISTLQVLAVGLIVALFLLVYGPFLFEYRTGLIRPDTTTYFRLGQEFMAGTIDTTLRTPGFPVLLYLFTKSFSQFAFVVLQSLVYLSSVLFLYMSLTRQYGFWMVGPALAASCLMILSTLALRYNVTLLTESLFMSGCLLYVAYLIFRMNNMRSIDVLLLSFLSVLLFLLRNSGLIFLAVNLALVAFSVELLKRPIRNVGLALVPLLAVVVLININNYVSAGLFRTTILSSGNVEPVLWQPSVEFPEPVNELLRSLMPDTHRGDLKRLKETWDLKEIAAIGRQYSKEIEPEDNLVTLLTNPKGHNIRMDIVTNDGPTEVRPQARYLMDIINANAIKKNRLLFYKLWVANLYSYCCLHFSHYNRWEEDFLGPALAAKVRFREKQSTNEELARSLLDPSQDEAAMKFVLTSPDGKWATNPANVVNRHVLRNMQFAKYVEMNSIWGYWALIVGGLSVFGLLLSRLRNKNLYVVAVPATIYGAYMFGFVFNGALYEVRAMVPMTPLNYFLCIVGSSIILREAYMAFGVYKQSRPKAE